MRQVFQGSLVNWEWQFPFFLTEPSFYFKSLRPAEDLGLGPADRCSSLKGSEDKQEGKSRPGGSHCSQSTASKLLGGSTFLRDAPYLHRREDFWDVEFLRNSALEKGEPWNSDVREDAARARLGLRACPCPCVRTAQRRPDFLLVPVEASFPPAASASAKLKSPSLRGRGRSFRGSAADGGGGTSCPVRPEGGHRSGSREGGWAWLVARQSTRAPHCPQLPALGTVAMVWLTDGSCTALGCVDRPRTKRACTVGVSHCRFPRCHSARVSTGTHSAGSRESTLVASS